MKIMNGVNKNQVIIKEISIKTSIWRIELVTKNVSLKLIKFVKQNFIKFSKNPSYFSIKMLS